MVQSAPASPIKSDVVLVANVGKLAPKIKDGIKGMKEQAEMVGQMGGGNAPNTKLIEIIAENWVAMPRLASLV